MNAIRIHKRIESETLHLPELKPLIGKTVEIIVLEEIAVPSPPVETLETFLGLAPPPEHVLDAKELEALCQDPKYKKFLPLLEVIGKDFLDLDAIVKLRSLSTT